MVTAVTQLDVQLAAGVRPRLVRLPDIGVLIRRRVVGQAAAARCDRFFNGIQRVTAITSHSLRDGITCRHDVQTLVAAQAELDGDSAACLHHVQGWQVVYGLEEAREVVADVVVHAHDAGVADVVCCIDRECLGAARASVDVRAVGDGANARGHT